jgi:glycosyltransferase involved in cell wall biosynthesis/2-polyprenyl-3-methyl-5-hydroxy-6-metoxy-1,4-benzoquinol methylase
MARFSSNTGASAGQAQAGLLSGYIERDGIFFPVDRTVEAFNYSDGDESENYVLDLIEKSADRSLFSPALIKGIRDWPSRYHLSPKRANLLRPFGPQLQGRVLEIGAGCGAITRFLGENGGDVVAIEGSARRARTARLRTADLANVRIVCDRYENLTSRQSFDVVIAIGVLEYAGIYGPDKDSPHVGFLSRLREYLTEDGVLILAIENQLGLKYFAGAREDHTGTPFYGVSDSYGKSSVTTFGREELSRLLRQAGLPSQTWFIPCPDYKVPNTVVSEELATAQPELAATLVAQATIADPQNPDDPLFSLEQGWQILGRNNLLLELANSFLVVAGQSPKAVNSYVLQADLGWHYSTERHPAFAKETRFVKAGDEFAVKRRLLTNFKFPPVPINLVAADEPLHGGQNWGAALVEIVNKPGWDVAQFAQWAKIWTDALARECGFDSLDGENFQKRVDGRHFDAAPFNMIRDADGGTRFFDQEWQLIPPVELGYLVVRGLRGALRINSCAPPAAGTPSNIHHLITLAMGHLGILVTRAEIDRYTQMESQIQAWVQGHPASDITSEQTQASWNMSLRVRGAAREAQEARVAELGRDLQSARDHLRDTRAQKQHLASELDALRAQKAAAEGKITQLESEAVTIRAQASRRDVSYERDSNLRSQLGIARKNVDLLRRSGQALLAAQWKIGPLRLLRSGLARQKLLQAYEIPSRRRIRRKDRALIANSGLFDPAWYAKEYPEYRQFHDDPFKHFCEVGEPLGYSPGPYFNTALYLSIYPDVARTGSSALCHFLRFGAREGRAPNVAFDPRYYLAANRDVATAGINPLVHYVLHGEKEQRRPHPAVNVTSGLRVLLEMLSEQAGPIHGILSDDDYQKIVGSPLFDSSWYLDHYRGVSVSGLDPVLYYHLLGSRLNDNPHPLFNTRWYRAAYLSQEKETNFTNPLLHYIAAPSKASISPHPLFDRKFYDTTYPDVLKVYPDSLIHYIRHGWEGTHAPSPYFSGEWYLKRYPEVATEKQNPLIDYLSNGLQNKRRPHVDFDFDWYLEANPDVRKAGIDPFIHYIEDGMAEGRAPSQRSSRLAPINDPASLARYQSKKINAIDWLKQSEILSRLDLKPVAYSQIAEDTRRALETLAEQSPLTISVIIPTWNRRATICAAIKSALGQSSRVNEIIVIDDGSIDDTVALVERQFSKALAAGQLILIKSKHVGLCGARNLGLERATGDLIAYLDSDNTWCPQFTTVYRALFEEMPQLMSAYCGQNIHEAGEVKVRVAGRPYDRRSLLQRNFIDLNGFIHRRELLNRFGKFDVALTRLVDWELILRVTSFIDPAYVPIILVDYYLDERGLKNVTFTENWEANYRKVSRKYSRDRIRCDVDGLRIGYVIWDWPALSQSFVLNELKWLLANEYDVKVYYKTQPDLAADLDFQIDAVQVNSADELVERVRDDGRNVLHSPFAYPATTLLTWPASAQTNAFFTFMPAGVDICHQNNRMRNRVGEVSRDERCLGLITLGTFHRQLLRDYGVPLNRMLMERQAVGLMDYNPRPAMPGRPRAISIGRFIEKKGFAYLIEAAAKFPEVDFALYGYGPLAQDLDLLVKKRRLKNVRDRKSVV